MFTEIFLCSLVFVVGKGVAMWVYIGFGGEGSNNSTGFGNKYTLWRREDGEGPGLHQKILSFES